MSAYAVVWVSDSGPKYLGGGPIGSPKIGTLEEMTALAEEIGAEVVEFAFEGPAPYEVDIP